MYNRNCDLKVIGQGNQKLLSDGFKDNIITLVVYIDF